MRRRKGIQWAAAAAALGLLAAGCGPKEKDAPLTESQMKAEGVATDARSIPETSLTDLKAGNITVDDGSGQPVTGATAPPPTPPPAGG